MAARPVSPRQPRPGGIRDQSTAIDRRVVDADGVFRKIGGRGSSSARPTPSPPSGNNDRPIEPGDVIVLIGRGPLGRPGRDLSTHVRPGTPLLRPRGGPADRRAVLRREHGRASAWSPRSVGGGPWASSATATASTSSSIATAEGTSISSATAAATHSGGRRPAACRPPAARDLAPDPLLPEETRLWAGSVPAAAPGAAACSMSRRFPN